MTFDPASLGFLFITCHFTPGFYSNFGKTTFGVGSDFQRQDSLVYEKFVVKTLVL